jgi:hypothetical protein
MKALTVSVRAFSFWHDFLRLLPALGHCFYWVLHHGTYLAQR